MNVKDIREAIKDLPDDMLVIIHKDSGDTGYSPLAGIDSDGIYIPDTTWCGYCYNAEWSAGDAGMEEEEWAEMLTRSRSLVLSPTH